MGNSTNLDGAYMAFNDIRNTNYLESKIKIFLENDYINVIGEENL